MTFANPVTGSDMKRFLLFIATLSVAGCLNTGAPTDASSNPATETFAASLHVDISKMTKTANGVYYSDTKVGTGATLTGVPRVSVTYTGYLKDGSTFAPRDSTVFDLSTLIFGMQDGMQGMREGGERVLVIPSALGYGPNGQGLIPPNSTLVFDVVLSHIG